MTVSCTIAVVDPRARLHDAAAAGHGVTPDTAHPARSADEVRAEDARRRLHAQGIVPIEPDERIGNLLERDELLYAVRRATSLERRQNPRGDDPGLRGDLYLTSRRLVHLGRTRVDYRLHEIRDAVVTAHRLVLVTDERRGVTIDVDDPRVLRVEIAAARAAARARVDDPRGSPGGQPSPR